MSAAKSEWAGYRPTGRGIDWANRSAEDCAADAAFSDAIVACVVTALAARPAPVVRTGPNPWDVPEGEDFSKVAV